MYPVGHQTVRLERGKHASYGEGACVIELASMLAGEPFSDHPQSVSPMIAGFLRAYNDLVDDQRRQDLYEYASAVVGTAASSSVEARRIARVVTWGHEMAQRRKRWWRTARFRLDRANLKAQDHGIHESARYAINSIGKITDETHAAALTLVDDLIAIGGGFVATSLVVPDDQAPSSVPLGELQ